MLRYLIKVCSNTVFTYTIPEAPVKFLRVTFISFRVGTARYAVCGTEQSVRRRNTKVGTVALRRPVGGRAGVGTNATHPFRPRCR